MNSDELNKLTDLNMSVVNKPPDDDTYGEATVSSNVFQHATNEEVDMNDTLVNGLIDEFARKYTEKWSSALNLKYKAQKLEDIKEFMVNNKLSINDIQEYINWLFRGRLTNKFKGNLGCLHSQPMFDEWKGKEIVSIGTTEVKFKKLKEAYVDPNFQLYDKYATPEEKKEWEKYFDLDYIGDDSMKVHRRIMANCKQRSKKETE